MLINNILLLIISLPIFTIIATLINKEVKYIVVEKQIENFTLKRKAPVPSHLVGGEH